MILNPQLRPGDDGRRRLRTLREHNRVPIFETPSLGDATDRVLALELGADGVLGKPCNPHELALRVAGLLQRMRHAAAAKAVLRLGR